MPTWIRTRWLVCWLLSALPFAGCATDTTSSQTGGLTVELELSDGIQIDQVNYEVTGGEMSPMVGSINTSAPGSTASVEIYGLPGGGPYTIVMNATSVDGETSCAGSVDFDVEVGRVTEVAVMLNCKPSQQFGGVRVDGTLNVCADLVKAVVAPLETSIGNQIDVLAIIADVEGDPIEYRWTGTGGTFADPSAAATTFTCQALGNHTITITASDDGFDYCTCDWTVDVTCVEGAGGSGGAGGSAGESGAGGAAGGGGSAGSAGDSGSGGAAGGGGFAGAGGEGGGAGGFAGAGGDGGGGIGGEGGQSGGGGFGGDGGIGGIGGDGGIGGAGGGGGSSGNICPNLNIINAIPSTIQPGNNSTMVQTRAQETDGLPLPLVLTLRALWGTFENTENIPMSGNVVGQNATYNCDRPGAVEICVDATDGACIKTLCTSVTCPDDIPVL
ncbi:MAG: hypothetical protein HKP50_08125 [Myxococcales bacterium]|nr:hypothetical protein [Myxococcales bacterium]